MKQTAEIIGLLAVLVGLVFVGIEIQQNTGALSAQALQDLNNSVNEDMRLIAENHELADIHRRGISDLALLDETEYVRFTNLKMSTFNTYEAAYFFHLKGLITDDDYAVWLDAACIESSYTGVSQLISEGNLVLNESFVELLSQTCPVWGSTALATKR